MAKKYETMFMLGAKVNPSLNRGFSQAQNRLSRLEKQAAKANKALSTIGSGIKGAVAGLIAKVGVDTLAKITNFSDTISQTKSRLDLMNDGLQTSAQLQNKIYESAQRSRTEYTDTAQVVAKLGILAKDSFKNNDEMIKFSELMSKQFKIGGASSEEQTSGMYQLTQAMASGKLQGDEFRSIMENAPLLAQSIAKYTGKSMGDLKEMSSDGEITADIIKKAMFASADETNKKFAKLPVTFGQIGVEAKNKIIKGFDPMFAKMGKTAAKLRPIILNTIDTAIPKIMLLYNKIETGITKISAKLSQNTQLKQAFSVLTDKIFPVLSEYLQWFANDILPIFIEKWTYIAKTVMPPILEVFNYIGTSVIPKLGAKFEEWMPKITNIVRDMSILSKDYIDKLVKGFEIAWPHIQNVVTFAIDVIGGAISGLLTMLEGVTTTLSGIAKGDWSKAWGGMQTIGKGAQGFQGSLIKPTVDILSKPFNQPEEIKPKSNLTKAADLMKNMPTNNKPVSTTYAPQYIIQGNADIDKIKELDKNNQKDFEQRAKKFAANNKRLGFAGG